MLAPEKLTIDTPEQIALEFPLAGAGSRFLALALDTLLQIAGFILIATIAFGALWLGQKGFRSLGTWIVAVLIVLGFLIYYAYFAAFEALWGGQTPGKRAIGLRVIRVSGEPINTFDALLRNLLRIVDQMPGIYAVGLLTVFLTSKNQRLGDLVAGTVVVREIGMVRASVPSAPVSTIRFGAGRLTAEEMLVVETFLTRRDELPDPMRQRTAFQLANRIRKRLELPAGAHRDEELIEAVAAEYRQR